MDFCVFFFKQKTAYEMLRSLVGSEMCIRDSPHPIPTRPRRPPHPRAKPARHLGAPGRQLQAIHLCLLYTSDAADDLLCVDLGGRRIIKKKTNTTKLTTYQR